MNEYLWFVEREERPDRRMVIVFLVKGSWGRSIDFILVYRGGGTIIVALTIELIGIVGKSVNNIVGLTLC